MNLTEWTSVQGIHPRTACRWFREGTPPVPALGVNSSSVLVSPGTSAVFPAIASGLYARVSPHAQRGDRDRQVARLRAWVAQRDLSPRLVLTGSAGAGRRGAGDG